VTRLEDDQKLQDLVLSVHHGDRHTFNDTGTTKLLENHHGRAYLQILTEVMAPVVVPPQPPVPQQPAVTQPPMNREQRRQQQRRNKRKGR